MSMGTRCECGCGPDIEAMTVRRGTTPTLRFDVPVDLTGCDVVHVAFRPRARHARAVVKTKEELVLDVTGGVTSVAVLLSQADTLGWPAGSDVEVQVRYKTGDVADASGICRLKVERILEEGVI